MNTGAFGEGFPYSNFHDLNMDWIIKIAKNFLDQYTHIQQIIADGETSLQELTESGLTQLEEKANALEALLQEWYNTHSNDIATQLADALSDLNEWYTIHENYLDQTLTDNIQAFNNSADVKTTASLASIPVDYTSLADNVSVLDEYVVRTPQVIFYKNLVKNVVVGKYPRVTDNVIDFPSATDFGYIAIPVKNGHFYTSSRNTNANFSMFGYEDGTFIGYAHDYMVTNYVFKAPEDCILYLSETGWNHSDLDIVIFESIVSYAGIANMDTTHYPFNTLKENIFDYNPNISEQFLGVYSNGTSGYMRLIAVNDFSTAVIKVYKGRKYVSSITPNAIFSFFTDNNFNIIGTIQDYLSNGIYTAPEDGFMSVCTNVRTPFFIHQITEGQNTWVVAQDGTGNCTRITDACNMANDGDTIYIKSGLYREKLALWGKNLHLVGEDKFNTIIIDSTGDYDAPPVEMNMGSISNLTIIEDFNGTFLEDRYAYCIHCESTENIGEGATLIIDNCILKNTKQACFGLGMQENLTVIVTNCDMTMEYPEGNTRTAGAFLWHTSIREDIGNQKLICKGNYFWSGSQYAMIYSNLGTGGNMKYTFINNHFYAKNGTPNTNDIALLDDRQGAGQVFELTHDSWGNNVPRLNY